MKKQADFSQDMQKRLQEMLMQAHSEGMSDGFNVALKMIDTLAQKDIPSEQIVAALRQALREKANKKASSEGGKCPPGGCVKQDSSGKWRIISNKDGHTWPQHYESREKAENALKAYHAASTLKTIRTARYDLWKVSEHKGVPKKVDEIAHAIERDSKASPEAAHRMAWETYCSYTNPSYEGCTEKGKSKRKSPKSEY